MNKYIFFSVTVMPVQCLDVRRTPGHSTVLIPRFI